jgi:hypothetical protein
VDVLDVYLVYSAEGTEPSMYPHAETLRGLSVCTAIPRQLHQAAYASTPASSSLRIHPRQLGGPTK